MFLWLVVLALAGLAVTSSPASAGDDDPESTTTTLAEGQDQGIIPEPNSGREPEEAGDRGGALQYLVFALVLTGIGGIVVLVVRESRRARARAATRLR